MRLTWRSLPFLLQRTLIAAFDDNCINIAKGAAYSALLSFFPVLTSAATILVQTRAQFVANTIQRFLAEVVPPGTDDLVVRQFQVRGARPLIVLVIAGLVSLWAASSVIKSLMEGFQAAYRIPRTRGFLRDSGVAISLVILSAVPWVAASLLILFGAQVEGTVLNWLKVDPELGRFAWLWILISRVTRYLVALATTVLVTSSLYYIAPYRKQRWGAVLPGAILATALWLLATSGFAYYVRHLGNYNVLYGSVATSILLLVWMYLMALIALLGCEFNAEYERLAKV